MREMWAVLGGGGGGVGVVVVVDGSGDKDDSDDVEGFLVVFGGRCCFSFSCSLISVSVRRSRIVFMWYFVDRLARASGEAVDGRAER